MAKISLRNPFYKHNDLRRNLTGPALIVQKNKRGPESTLPERSEGSPRDGPPRRREAGTGMEVPQRLSQTALPKDYRGLKSIIHHVEKLAIGVCLCVCVCVNHFMAKEP